MVMRILYSHRVQSRDGQAVHIDELIGAFRDAGHDVLVVGPPAYQKAEFGAESSVLAGIRNRLPGFMYEILELLYNIPAGIRLRRAMKEFRPDFIYERYNLFFSAVSFLRGCTECRFILKSTVRWRRSGQFMADSYSSAWRSDLSITTGDKQITLIR